MERPHQKSGGRYDVGLSNSPTRLGLMIGYCGNMSIILIFEDFKLITD
jgi:hypothetical protein